MKQARKFYIYSRSSLSFLIFLVAMTLIAIIQLLLEDNFVENLIVLLADFSLLMTVGWIAFSSMGRLEIRAEAAQDAAEGEDRHHLCGDDVLHEPRADPAAADEEEDGVDIVVRSLRLDEVHVCHDVFDRPCPDGDLYADVEELGDDAERVARACDEAADRLGYTHAFIRIAVAEAAAVEEHPDDEGDEDEPDIGDADPEEFGVAHGGERLRAHGEAVVEGRGVQMREDDVFREEESRHRAERVERLRGGRSSTHRRARARRGCRWSRGRRARPRG